MKSEDTIRLLDDLYHGLTMGVAAADALLTHQTHWAGREAAEHKLALCQRGLKAYAELSRRLGEGRLHVEPPPDAEPPTECHCATTSHPPCSVCCP